MRVLALLLLLMPLRAFAQSALADSTGQIVGLVTDAGTGEVLPGTNVILLGTTMGVATEIDGHFLLADVPPGLYTVRASYAGYEFLAFDQVEVRPGKEVRIEAALRIFKIVEVPPFFYEPFFPMLVRAPHLSRVITTQFGDTGRWKGR